MKVVYVTMVFPKASEAFACVDVSELARSGVDVRVLALQPPVADFDSLVADNDLSGVSIETGTFGRLVHGALAAAGRPRRTLDLLRFICRHSIRKPGHLARSLVLLPRIMWCFSRIEEIAPDVVHLFWGHYPALVGYLVERYHPEIVVSQFLGAYDLEYGYGPSAPVAERADVLFTHANANLPKIRALGIKREDIAVVHRGVRVDAPVAGGDKEDAAVVAAGRLRADKAFDDVLAVFDRVRRERPDATLVIAGDGPERQWLESRARRLAAADAITFAGHVSQSRLFELLDRGRVFLLMSRSPTERLPNVIKEAVLHGCVIVTTRTDGIEELVTDGVDGYIVEQGDIAAAADRVSESIADPAGASVLASNGRTRVLENFDVRDTMRRYVERWHSLARSRRAG